MDGNTLRTTFLQYFAGKGHEIVASSSLVPHNDPTLLFTNAGMVQFKDTFLQLEERPYKRATTSQKCVRAGGKHNDLDTVGKTARHHTFFEMLGNFSFGDYFKEGAIAYAWEFLTEVLQLEKDRLYITIYQDDDEAKELWQKIAGIPAERIIRLGEKDNFWSMGDTGPCGPCSEIHYDRGEEFSCGAEECAIGKCECDRWLEIWNLVFMQFNRDEKGVLTPLPKPSIDTGMGLERVASIMQNVPSNYDTDLLRKLIIFIEKETGKTYNQDERGFPMRVIADHARSCTFLIADGVLPSNEGRGYVLRRILRRAARFARLLGMDEAFLWRVTPVVVEMMGEQFPEIREKEDFIVKVIRNEEERFHLTLTEGLKVVEEKIATIKKAGKNEICGADAFLFYDTYGFPIDLTEDIAGEHQMTVDIPGFEAAMNEQRQRARAARSSETGYALDMELSSFLKDLTATKFLAYETMRTEGKLLAIISGGEKRTAFTPGESAYLVFDQSPFYPEGGGQVGDRGQILGPDGKAFIENTFKLPNGIIMHKANGGDGLLTVGNSYTLEVTKPLRKATMRNHTATHLLHKALREVLGEHVHQAGSLVNEERLRFDFSHFSSVTADELKAVEDKVNRQILENLPVVTELMSLAEAKESGATALFDEKYGDEVRVVAVGDWSKELCGGTHVENIGEIGLLKIISESSVGAGLRRIEAFTGENARQYFLEQEAMLGEIRDILKAKEGETILRIKSLQEEVKDLQRELERFRQKEANAKVSQVETAIEETGNGKFLVAQLADMDMVKLREAADNLRSKEKDLALVLFSAKDNKVNIIVASGKCWQEKGLLAGKMIKEIAPIVGGGGGGRPDLAQAGGKDVDKIPEAVKKAREIIIKL